jgi:hypothetical protein
MIEKMDRALIDLTEMAIDAIAEAKHKKYFDHDFIESACMILSMAYGRFEGDDRND